MIYRVFVEKKENLQAKKIREDLSAQLGIAVEDLREVIRYDAEGLSEEELQGAIVNVFSEPPVDNVWRRKSSPSARDTRCSPSPFWTGSTTSAPTAPRSACSF